MSAPDEGHPLNRIDPRLALFTNCVAVDPDGRVWVVDNAAAYIDAFLADTFEENP